MGRWPVAHSHREWATTTKTIAAAASGLSSFLIDAEPRQVA
jgi:hypothetical protein